MIRKFTIAALFLVASLSLSAQTFICSTATCGGGTTILSSAPTDGSTFYIVWFISSSNTPISATATPQPSTTSGTANIGSTSITNTSGTNYTIAIAASINSNQNKPTVSNVDVNLAFFTSASFPGSAGTASMAIPTATPLPVDFQSINASSTAVENTIEWSTASEFNNDRFIVERSMDGSTWNEIGEVAGAGTSQEVLNYTFTDATINTSVKHFYRIKQIDFDGKFDFSDVVSTQNSKSGITIFPNPAVGNEVTVKTASEIVTFEVRNLAGQVIAADFNFDTKILNISTLESGIYFIQVNESVIRFVK